ncbi:MAG TPA: efflux RND transporter periplasmic adaptor subunit [Longimicrobiales bacterium]
MHHTKSARIGALIIAGSSFLFTACGGDDPQPRAGQAAGQTTGRSGAPADRVVPVQVAGVTRGAIARNVTVAGTVEPIRTIGVNSQLAGALLTVNAQEGDVVRQGEVLARVDDRELQAQLAAAEAAFQVAEAQYERAQQLRDRKVITAPEYERDRTAYASAKAQYDQLKTRIGYATVRSPLSGVVTEKMVETGDVVGNQQRLFAIADISSMVVRVGVSELDVVQLRTGDRVTVTLDAIPDRPLHGRIRRVFPQGDPTTRLVPVEVVLDAESARVARPGFLARVTFALGARDGVLLVPGAAVVGGQGGQAVFVVQDGKAVRRAVETGVTSEGRVEIRSGLSEGEQIVVAGNNLLRDGMGVRAVSATEGSPGAAQ